MGKVYVVILHDESWGNHGDHIFEVFDNEELAIEQVNWLEENLELLDGDYVTYCEYDISNKVIKRGKGVTISTILYDQELREDES